VILQLCDKCICLLLNGQVCLDTFDADTEKILEGSLEHQRLAKEQAGIQSEDWKVKVVLSAKVDHHQSGTLEAARFSGKG
jgi:hypothetical protein